MAFAIHWRMKGASIPRPATTILAQAFPATIAITSHAQDASSSGGGDLNNTCNYDPSATIDDGSCVFVCLGCTDSNACNFDVDALQDNGTCIYPEDLGWCDCEGTSFIDALGVCGGDCEADDDGDGICDDVDDCVGSYDACGVCNGPGAIYECGCSGLPDGSCDCSICRAGGHHRPMRCLWGRWRKLRGVHFTSLDLQLQSRGYNCSANETCEFGTCTGCTDPSCMQLH